MFNKYLEKLKTKLFEIFLPSSFLNSRKIFNPKKMQLQSHDLIERDFRFGIKD